MSLSVKGKHYMVSLIQLCILVVGLVITVAEFLFKLMGKGSFCQSDGCAVVAGFVGKTELIILAGGILFFALLLVAFFKDHSGWAVTLLLLGALATEGYLMAFQVFTLREACHFCFIVGLLIITYAILQLRHTPGMALSYCVTFLSVFMVGALVNNPVSHQMPGDQTVLIFSKDCPHCLKVIEFIKANGLDVKTCDYTCQQGFLATLKIEELPVLVVSPVDARKEIYIGANSIITVLAKEIQPKGLLNVPLGGSSLPLFENEDNGACKIKENSCGS